MEEFDKEYQVMILRRTLAMGQLTSGWPRQAGSDSSIGAHLKPVKSMRISYAIYHRYRRWTL